MNFFTGRGNKTANQPLHAVVASFILLAKRLKRLAPLLAAPAALLLNQGQAKAVLTYNIFESAGNVVVQASGNLNLSGATSTQGQSYCGNGRIISNYAILCTGISASGRDWLISGPSNFNGKVSTTASSVSGITTILNGNGSFIGLDPNYTSGSPIASSATFNSQTLAGLGFTTTGLIGTWTLDGTSETIQVFLGSPSPSGAAAPGPLPLLGAGAAFGWSRRLRRRTTSALSEGPQA